MSAELAAEESRDWYEVTEMNLEDFVSKAMQDLAEKEIHLKPNQLEAVKSFWSGKDVFVSF